MDENNRKQVQLEPGPATPMDTEQESKCSQEGNEIPDEYFQGETYVTETESFAQVCLLREVLKTTLRGLNNLRGDEINICNRSHRHAG